MEENKTSNSASQNPSGVWQGIWGNLFFQFNQQMLENSYLRAWKTIQLLKSQIPPECEIEIQTEYDKVYRMIKSPMQAYTSLDANRMKMHQLNTEAPDALLSLLSNIRKSLYDKKWINRPDFTAQPKYEKKGHL
jgi:hypothetical protein